MQQIQIKLDLITAACGEIQQALNEHLQATTNVKYKADIEKDLVTLDNLKHLVVAVRSDIDSDKIGASTELLLRIAANDFKNKLTLIPEKKTKIREIVQALNDIHKHVLRPPSHSPSRCHDQSHSSLPSRTMGGG